MHSMLEASVLQLGSGPVRLGDWLRGRGGTLDLETPPDDHGEAVNPLRRFQLQIFAEGCGL